MDTRLARVGADLDAVVVALAGLLRLGRDDEATEVLGTGTLLPAPGQGALAVETRADWDDPAYGRFARIHDPEGNPIELWQPPA